MHIDIKRWVKKYEYRGTYNHNYTKSSLIPVFRCLGEFHDLFSSALAHLAISDHIVCDSNHAHLH